jgi:hypothetical protein
MSPVTTPSVGERLRHLLSLPRRSLRALFPEGVPRWLWGAFQALALTLALAGSYYAWREFPRDVQVEPAFFAVAAGLYVLAFVAHLLGWHALTGIFFGRMSLRDDAEALAGSNLVKYLPTIIWYIANRSHYYHQRGVEQQRVVIASLSELALMVGSGATLLVSLWAAQVLTPLAAVPVAALGLGSLAWALGRHAGGQQHGRWWRWALALLWYGASWPLGALILAALMAALAPVTPADVGNLALVWLVAGLASYVVSLTLGAIGILREITLTVLLAQQWPLATVIAAAICVKLVLTLGEIVCSLLVLGGLRLWRRLKAEG